MRRIKLIFAIAIIILLATLLAGCNVFDVDEWCCSGLAPLPIALVCYSLLGTKK